MEKNVFTPCCLIELQGDELMQSGGSAWRDLWKFMIRIAGSVKEFADDYTEDMKQGFKEGWESV